MCSGLFGHPCYDVLRDLGGLSAGVIALLAAGIAYSAAIEQVKATARAADDQIKALMAQEERETQNVREAVQIEITSMVVGVIEVANLLARLRKEGNRVFGPQLQDMIARLGTPTIYPQVSDRVGLLFDPYSVVIFYSSLAEARLILSSTLTETESPVPDFVGRTLNRLNQALLLARPIVAGELLGGQRLDLARRQHTTTQIDTCLRDIFGIDHKPAA
jgi:hypothetical protein